MDRPPHTSSTYVPATNMTTASAVETVIAYTSAFRARLYIPAPMFWATKEDMDCM